MNFDHEKVSDASVEANARDLAGILLQYGHTYDPYEYRDTVEDPERSAAEIETELLNGRITPFIEQLESDIAEHDDVNGLHAAAELIIMLLKQYQAQREELGLSTLEEVAPVKEAVQKSLYTALDITSLHELYNTITRVVNHILESGAKSTDSGNCIVKHEDVAHFLNKDDFNRYFMVIAGELAGREEVRDISVDGFEGQISFVIGPEWCSNYKPLPVEVASGLEYGVREVSKKPTLTDLLTTGYSSAVDTSDLVEIFCYADQVLPQTDRAELLDSHYNAHFVVPKHWAEEQAKQAGFENLENFLDEYTWDHTDGWYEKAFQDGVLQGVGLGVYTCNEKTVSKEVSEKFSLDQKVSRAQETAEHLKTSEFDKTTHNREADVR